MSAQDSQDLASFSTWWNAGLPKLMIYNPDHQSKLLAMEAWVRACRATRAESCDDVSWPLVDGVPFDYPAAARSIMLNLADLIDPADPIPLNIANAARKARDRMIFLMGALGKYGRHSPAASPLCEKSKNSIYNCTCGFEGVMDRAGSLVPETHPNNPYPDADMIFCLEQRVSALEAQLAKALELVTTSQDRALRLLDEKEARIPSQGTPVAFEALVVHLENAITSGRVTEIDLTSELYDLIAEARRCLVLPSRVPRQEAPVEGGAE